MINRTQLTDLFFEGLTEEINRSKTEKYIEYLAVIDKLREIGEYNAAVNYLAGASKILNIDSKKFDNFCNSLFSSPLA